MPAWLHARAEHIMAKNPDMPKSEAFAISTQQSHALGKSPKSYGTAAGRRTAKQKYKTPEDDVKTAMDVVLEETREKTAFSTNTFSGPMNPVIESGASYLPPAPVNPLRVPVIKKVAATRYEQEISSGNITRGDVTPGIVNLPGPLGAASRKATRSQLSAQASVAPEQIAKARALSQKLYTAQAAHPESQGVGGYSVVKQLAPNAGAAMDPDWGAKGQTGYIYAPETAGQYLRTMRDAKGPEDTLRAAGATLSEGDAKRFLTKRIPMDATLNHAVLQHELGEGAEAKKPMVRPFATHLGPEPIIRENLAGRNDPEAAALIGKVRQGHREDVLIQRAVRQAGGTPNAPIPLGGRQHRAVERILDRNVAQLSSTTRQKALDLGALTGKTVGYVPPQAAKTMWEMGQATSTAKGALSSLVKKPSIEGLKGLWDAGKTLVRARGNDASTFVRKGVVGTPKLAFKLQGEMKHQGLDIAIENRKGSVRSGKDKDGKPWRTVMKNPYGYIRGTKGADGEEVDAYVGPDRKAPNVYAVHQKKDNGAYDEDKLILGVNSKEEARKLYLKHYNTDKFLGPIKELSVERLKKLMASGKALVKISEDLSLRTLF